jgi:hypothetical protein
LTTSPSVDSHCCVVGGNINNAIDRIPTGGVSIVARNNTNRVEVPQAKEALNRMKYEVASSLGINLNPGYNGNLSTYEAGKIGGNMVKPDQPDSKLAAHCLPARTHGGSAGVRSDSAC